LAKSRPSVQKRRKESAKMDKLQQKQARKAARQALRERRAESIAQGMDPAAFDKAEAEASELRDLNARFLPPTD